MAYLGVIVGIVGGLGLFNLMMMLGVVRRLREHSAHLEKLLEAAQPQEIMAPVGTHAPEFTTRTLSGEELSSADLMDNTLVGFFSAGCGPCKEQVPRFVEYAASAPGGPKQIIAVVAAEGEDIDAVFDLDKLGAVARVVSEPSTGTMSKAFQIRGYPALCLVNHDRKITASGSDVAMFPALQQQDAHDR